MTTPSNTDWQPTTSVASLKSRALLIQQIRQYFTEQNVLEVETPCLSNSTVTDPYLEAFEIAGKYLQTSPEYAMKRLLAHGSGDIYQISKAFRNEDLGRFHNPEFTLLEWYRCDFTLADMFSEIEQLLRLTLGISEVETHRYADLFSEHLDVNVHSASIEELKVLLDRHCNGLSVSDVDDCLTALFATCIEPNIGQQIPCIVSHFPSSQASLARLDPDDPREALRFEVYYRGTELANGFHELTDPVEQKQRFESDNSKRLKNNLPEKPIDQRFLAALQDGLPDCVGVALGIDRLLMLKLGADSISQVMSFDFSNA